MRFLSDILAKAGLIVDGAAVFNSSATGQTPATNDNSTKFATTAWVRSFVQPYTLPIASSTVLGGIKVGTGLAIDALTGVLSVSSGSITLKSTQTFTATAGQTVVTISGGYTVGLIDVFLNGVYLSPGQTTATNGSTVTLADAALAGDIIDVIITSPIGQGSIATTDSLPEGTVNLYYTPTRARTAISLTTTGVSGAATYNNVTGVFNIPNYQGLVPANGVAGQILAKASGTSYDTTWIDNYTSQVQHQVKLGAAMTIGTPVYVSGSTGNSGTNMIVSKASNATEGTSSKTLGLLASGGNTNDIVFVITEGLLSGLDTSTASAGDPVWLGVNGTLIFGLLNKPVAPAHLVFIGIVTRAQQNNGEIFVKVQNGFELDELHDLSVKNASDGDMIKYVASTGLWTKIAASTTNIVEGTNLYYTDARVSAYLTANSYATQGFVNTAISNLVASAPTTLDTLNELATALGNDPNFATTIATSIGTKVPQTRTITINGTGYDLSADRSWSIAAGVTSFNTRTGAITLTSGDVTGALGYTPYNSTNPSGYITSSALSSYLLLSGGTLTGLLTIGNFDGQALKLQAGTSTGNSYIRFYNSSGGAEGYLGLFNNAGSNYYLLDASSRDLNLNGGTNIYLQIAGSTKTIITGAGNMGIGTTSVPYKLVVAGSSHSLSVNPHAVGIDLHSSGNMAPHYQSNFVWYTGAIGSGTQRASLDGSGNFVATGNITGSTLYVGGGTSYYINNGTSNLNGLNINDGNLELYKAQTVDMSNTAVFSTANYYPVIIGIPNSGVTIQIQNNLNSNVPSWSTHGGGFTLNLKWETNGSGWGTTAVKRKVYQYHERFNNQRICGGITQMGNSSIEVVWLRGGGTYYFTFSRNVSASPQSSTYSVNYESVAPTSAVINDVWNAAAGQEIYYAGAIYSDNLYTGGGNGYHASFKPATNATFNIGNSTGNRGILGPFLNATLNGSADTTSVPMFFNCESFHVFCNYDQKMRIEATYGDMHLRGYIYQGNTSWSDLRMKQNLQKITDPLTKINAINGYTFEWREWTGYRNTPEIMERINDAGLIAQEVEAVLPAIVETDVNRDQKSMNYNGVIALHTEGIKELIKQNQELLARVIELESRL